MVYRDQTTSEEQLQRGFALLQERGYAKCEGGRYSLTAVWGITYRVIREELPEVLKNSEAREEAVMTLAILSRGLATPSDISYMSRAISVLDKIENQRN